MQEQHKPFQLQSSFQPSGDQPQAIKTIHDGLDEGHKKQILLGVTGSGKTYTMANIIHDTQRPALVMAPNKTLAAQLYRELRDFFPDNAVEYFVSYYDYYQPEAYVPSSDTYIAKDASVNDQIEQMRLSATKAMMERKDVIVVSTVSAIYGLGDPEAYFSMVLHLYKGQAISIKEISTALVQVQYMRNRFAYERGTFSVQGDAITVFPADEAKNGIRITLFDDEIECIEAIDPLTGEITHRLERVTIYPKTHYATPRQRLLDMIDFIKDELKERLTVLRELNKLVEAQRLEERTRYDIEMILELGYCTGIENYSRYLSGRGPGEPPPTLMNYLPDNALLFIDESHVTVPQLRAMYKGDRARKMTLVEYGFRLPSALDNRPLKFEDFEAASPQTIYVSATPSVYEKEEAQSIAELIIRPTGLIDPPIEIRPATHQVDNLIDEIKKVIAKKQRILVTTLTKKMAEDLTDYLNNECINVRYLHSDVGNIERVEIIDQLRHGQIDVIIGINLLREGLDIPEVALVAVLDADKEGFLRSESALVQTSGRAARNVEGRVIFYADRETNSIQRTLAVCEARRNKQLAYNDEHGITPKTVSKKLQAIIKEQTDIEDTSNPYHGKTNSELEQLYKQIEKRMFGFADQLNFEEAAKCRDELEAIQEELIAGTSQ